MSMIRLLSYQREKLAKVAIHHESPTAYNFAVLTMGQKDICEIPCVMRPRQRHTSGEPVASLKWMQT